MPKARRFVKDFCPTNRCWYNTLSFCLKGMMIGLCIILKFLDKYTRRATNKTYRKEVVCPEEFNEDLGEPKEKKMRLLVSTAKLVHPYGASLTFHNNFKTFPLKSSYLTFGLVRKFVFRSKLMWFYIKYIRVWEQRENIIFERNH